MIIPNYRKAVTPSRFLGEQSDLRAVNQVSERAIKPVESIRKGQRQKASGGVKTEHRESDLPPDYRLR
jgi:hypothetical protein